MFIDFTLSAMKASLIDAAKMSDRKLIKATTRWQKIEQFLQMHEYIMNADVRELFDVSTATANRILSGLMEDDNLIKQRKNGR